MKNFSQFFVFAICVLCNRGVTNGGFHSFAEANESAPTLAQSVKLSPAEVGQVLKIETHIDNSWLLLRQAEKRPSEYALFTKQVEAINQTGQQRLFQFVPNLVHFLDYPSSKVVDPFHAPNSEFYLNAASDSWSAFAAIQAMGKDAIKPLTEFVGNAKESLRLRLTALQILQLLKAEQARPVGELLQKQTQESGQRGATQQIDLILKNKLPFWGVIEFQPLTLSKEEIINLLRPERHLTDVFAVVMDGEGNLPENMARPRKNDYPLFDKQREAIRHAGELRLTELVPELIVYVDYPVSIAAASYVSSRDNFIEGRRQKYPAIDAILKIGKPAIPHLEAALKDTKFPATTRLNILQIFKSH